MAYSVSEINNFQHDNKPANRQIVREPFDGDRQAIDPAEPMLDRSDHQITHVLTADAAGGDKESSWLHDHSNLG
jgi:hypothetical protein